MTILAHIRSFTPEPLITLYHWCLAYAAAAWYRFPSDQLIVIGVTGTNGKTTTSYFIAKALEATGLKVGCTSTALLKIAGREWINSTKMTMPGRFFLQSMLRKMADEGCTHVVIETSSQGIVQHRHAAVAYDVAVFTNLTPEHIESHGGFENYKNAKKVLFDHVARRPKKMINDLYIPTAFVLNGESTYAAFYGDTRPAVDRLQWYGIDDAHEGLRAENVVLSGAGSDARVQDVSVHVSIPGRFNVENALAALATVRVLGRDLKSAAEGLARVTRVPGRMERVEEGQSWTTIVDYAPEPESLRRLYDALTLIPHKRLIHVLGSCGGGRDIARQPILGQMAGSHADIVIVTNEDPYDDDPWEIIHRVADGAKTQGKEDEKTLYQILDRREAIQKAMLLAESEDLVLMTGKACEPWMCLANGQKIPWDEVRIAREAIREALAKKEVLQA
jgi:UDP-N-acetylmuramoyl-L-alanyl-D-glutamate--2,6-diaminopimelate ligase